MSIEHFEKLVNIAHLVSPEAGVPVEYVDAEHAQFHVNGCAVPLLICGDIACEPVTVRTKTITGERTSPGFRVFRISPGGDEGRVYTTTQSIGTALSRLLHDGWQQKLDHIIDVKWNVVDMEEEASVRVVDGNAYKPL